MKMHHLKHAGFFLAVLALLFNTGLLAVLRTSEVGAAGGGYPFQIDITVSGAGGKTHYDSPAWTGTDTCPGAQCYYYSSIAPSDPASQLTLGTILDAGKRVKSWAFAPGSGSTPALNCTQGNSSSQCTVPLPSGADMAVTNARSYNLTVTIEDIPPASTSTTTTTTTTTTTKKATTPPTTTTTQPAATTVTNVAFNGQANTSTTDAAKAPEFKAEDSVVLTGTAAPNTKVNVYVFSDPQKFTVTSDKDGKWTLTLPKLPAGDHHVESAVVDTKGQEGTRQQLGAFKVLAATASAAKDIAKPATTTTAKKASTNWKLIIPIIVVSLLAIGYIVWYWLHHKSSLLNHHNVKKPEPPHTIDPAV